MIATLASTVVLLPSLDLEECVTDTMRRERERYIAHHRTDVCEEEVIRERFPVYMDRKKLGSEYTFLRARHE
jgi:hypothetical protein